MDTSSFQAITVNPLHFTMLVALLNGLGKAIKEIPQVSNRLIPLLLCVLGGTAHGFLSGWTPESVMVGSVAGLGAVGGHQLVSNTNPIAKDSRPDSTRQT